MRKKKVISEASESLVSLDPVNLTESEENLEIVPSIEDLESKIKSDNSVLEELTQEVPNNIDKTHPSTSIFNFTENIAKENEVSITEKKEEVFSSLISKKKYVYQMTFYEDKEREIVLFSYEKPEFVNELGFEKIVLKDCFKKYTLTENVLNKKIIKVAFKGEGTIDKVDLDLRMGVVLKTIEETAWMKIEKDKAERAFHTKVLESYRAFAKEMKLPSPQISDNDSEFEPL